ncbi:MAG: pirin family protein [Phycisphaerales bacterium]|jgi:hypothetical protein
MISIRKSSDRGHFNFGWLDTNHTFSFGQYRDPKFMGFRSLRVINEDRVAPGQGFGEHPHEDMEIISYVLDGALAHQDSLGTVKSLSPGEVQRMSAGSGIRHSEFNHSDTRTTHFLQIWIRPDRRGVTPGYDQRRFGDDQRANRLCLVISPDGAEGSISIHQDAKLYTTNLDAGKSVTLDLAAGRHAWVQVTRGEVTLNGQRLAAGDGAAVSEETALTLQATQKAEVLVFDLA